jgi:ABC-type dipeptide/oligopeptide/nickel transport system permease component
VTFGVESAGFGRRVYRWRAAARTLFGRGAVVVGVLPFVLRRLLAAIPVMIVISATTFFIFRFAPGDPVSARLGPRATPEQVERLKAGLGLDRPLYQQYLGYMGGLLRGDLGESYKRPGYTVAEIIFPKMWISFQLNLLPFFLVYLLGIPIGIYMALRRGRWQDPALTVVLLLASAIPVMVLTPFLQWLFALKLQLLPVGGWDGIFSTRIILPTIVLTVGGIVGIARITRISVIQVLGEDFVRTARAKGLPEGVVINRHTLRNALLPLTNGIILGMFALFSGTFFVELLFGIPGIAREAYDSIGSRDYDMLMAFTMIGALGFVLANIVLDIVYTIIDPRIRITDGGA